MGSRIKFRRLYASAYTRVFYTGEQTSTLGALRSIASRYGRSGTESRLLRKERVTLPANLEGDDPVHGTVWYAQKVVPTRGAGL